MVNKEIEESNNINELINLLKLIHNELQNIRLSIESLKDDPIEEMGETYESF